MVKEPLALADIRPTCVPARDRCFGTIALTISPVLNPCLGCFSLGFPLGNPNSSDFCIRRHPCPEAVIASGTTPFILKTSGVDFPTHAASNQWVFGSSRVVRLYLVSPP